jgi:predicted ATPase
MAARPDVLRSPFLKTIRWRSDDRPKDVYPFNLPIFEADDFELIFTRPVTILVGENATGKSTLLEALAELAGFHGGGGSRDHNYRAPDAEGSSLVRHLRASWLPKATQGFFFRADSYINLAAYVEEMAVDWPIIRQLYGERHLHRQSHGESFLSLFENRLKASRYAFYLLDEPESALSPRRQLQLMRLIHGWAQTGRVQIVLATHAPMLMALPGATLLHLTASGIAEVNYRATPHFETMADFFRDPDRMIEGALSAPED